MNAVARAMLLLEKVKGSVLDIGISMRCPAESSPPAGVRPGYCRILLNRKATQNP